MLLDLFRKIPVSRLLIPYLAGILLLAENPRAVWSFLLLGCWALVLYRLFEKRLPSAWTIRWLPGFGLFCLWAALGGIGMSRLDQQASFPGGNPFAADVRLISLPVAKPKSNQVLVQVDRTEPGFEAWEGKQLQLYVSKTAPSFGIGDRLRLNLRPQQPTPPATAYDFDFAAWLRRKGICGTAYVKKATPMAKAPFWHVKAQAEKMRLFLLRQFRQAGIEGAEFALVSALVLGETNQLDQEIKSDFSVSGISHILSVSGLHVAVVYAVLAFLLSFLDRFDRWRIPKQIILILLLFFYAFLTGLSPSVLRSAFMFSLLALGKCLRRKSQTLNTVLFSAFVLLLWNPGYLYDLGFQLSYLAVLFIVVVHPRLVALWNPPNKAVGYVWEMLCLSIVAQLGTSPITVHAFHTFPNYFLLNNLVAVPFSSLLIYVALFFLMVSSIPWVGVVVGKGLNALLQGFLFMVETTGDLPHALTKGLYPSTLEVLGLYVLVLTAFMAFLLKRRAWILPFLGSVLVLQLVCLATAFPS